MAALVDIKTLQGALEHAAKMYFDTNPFGSGAGEVSVIVGYTARYALYVHENVEMKWRGRPRSPSGALRGKSTGRSLARGAQKKKGRFWDPQGRAQAKFLEMPARVFAREIGRVVVAAIKRGAKFGPAMVMGGLRLQRESMLRVPVDTGNLKASAFTRREK